MRLSPRLLRLASKIADYSVVADIGTDHALLPIYLVLTGRCPRVIAIEAAEGPFQVAKTAIESFCLQDAIDLRFADGLHGLSPGEADVVVMAGMGGSQMIHILSDNPSVRATIPAFVLQPTCGAPELRRFLIGNGFRLADEELVRDGNEIYEIICATPGSEPMPDEILLEVGPRVVERRDPLLREFVDRRIQHYRRILVQVEQGTSQRAVDALRELQERVRRLDQLAREVSPPSPKPERGGDGP